ncbi:MAG: GNAT family N-acetyltransferase [Oscillospiraceae bacterium]|nr:GNAT family N-acetyltransferase [Oscillospiraceae bacterium]
MMFKDIKLQITNPEVGRIIALAAFEGSEEGVAKEAAKYISSDALHFFGWVDDDKILGICGFEVHEDKVEIHLISVAKEHHHKGIGVAMITALESKYHLPIEAETDDDAVGFYRRCGFETKAFKHAKWGVPRHTCVLNGKN